MSRNRIRLTVGGTECVVGTDDNEPYVRRLAEEVQDCMLTLSHQNEHASSAVTAIVAALSFCDDYHKSQQTAMALQQQMAECMADGTRAKTEAEEAKQEAEQLRQEVAALRARLGEDTPDAGNVPIQRGEYSGDFTRLDAESSVPDFLSLFEETPKTEKDEANEHE